jgi:hypothetical protein
MTLSWAVGRINVGDTPSPGRPQHVEQRAGLLSPPLCGRIIAHPGAAAGGRPQRPRAAAAGDHQPTHLCLDGGRHILDHATTTSTRPLGLVTACSALGARGDTVVLFARGAKGPAGAAVQMERAGGAAHVMPADVADPSDGEALLHCDEFGASLLGRRRFTPRGSDRSRRGAVASAPRSRAKYTAGLPTVRIT